MNIEQRLNYLEEKVKEITKQLKDNGYLDKDFNFFTTKENKKRIEDIVDEFINQDHLENHL